MRTIKFRAFSKLNKEMYQIAKLNFQRKIVFMFSNRIGLDSYFDNIELM